MKTLIAIPCMETVHTDFARSLVDLTRNAPAETHVCFKKSSLIYDSRNLLSLTAMDCDYDRIFWLDSDMVFDPNTLLSLHKDMDETGADIITGLYVKRHTSVLPVLYKTIQPPSKNENGEIEKCVVDYLDYPPDRLFPVAGAGFGCVLMSVPLLRKLWNDYGPPFSPFVWAGEDISFFHRANMAGANILCDSRIRLGHVGNVTFTPDFYEAKRNETR